MITTASNRAGLTGKLNWETMPEALPAASRHPACHASSSRNASE